MHLITPGDDVDTKLKQKHERKQAQALLECFKSSQPGSLAASGWMWPLAGRCVPAAVGGGAVADVDSLMFVPGQGLVVLEFKDKSQYSEEDLRQVDRQARAIRSACQEIIATWDSKRCPIPALPPRILRAVGYMRLRQARLNSWQAANSAVFDKAAACIGAEAWDEHLTVQERATHISAVIDAAFTSFNANYLLNTTGPRPTAQHYTRRQFLYLLERLRDDLPNAVGLRDYLEVALDQMQVSTDAQSRGGLQDLITGWGASDSSVLSMTGKQIHVVLLPGLAGTGKTWTALYTAVAMARVGRRILLTCRSPRVQEFMKNWIDELAADSDGRFEGVDVLRPDQLGLFKGFEWHSRESWRRLLDQPERYDVVLVDEAQDFGLLTSGEETSLDFMLGLIREGGMCALFADPSQATLDGSVGVTENAMTGRVLAQRTINLRSTPEIVDFIEQTVGCGYFMDPLAPRRASVRIQASASRETEHVLPALTALMQSIASDLEFESGMLPSSRTVVLVEDENELGRLRSASGLSRDLAALEWATVDQFKGLERDFVLMPLAGESLTGDMDRLSALAYTGFSRARVLLGVVAPKDAGLRLPQG